MDTSIFDEPDEPDSHTEQKCKKLLDITAGPEISEKTLSDCYDCMIYFRWKMNDNHDKRHIHKANHDKIREKFFEIYTYNRFIMAKSYWDMFFDKLKK